MGREGPTCLSPNEWLDLPNVDGVMNYPQKEEETDEFENNSSRKRTSFMAGWQNPAICLSALLTGEAWGRQIRERYNQVRGRHLLDRYWNWMKSEETCVVLFPPISMKTSETHFGSLHREVLHINWCLQFKREKMELGIEECTCLELL